MARWAYWLCHFASSRAELCNSSKQAAAARDHLLALKHEACEVHVSNDNFGCCLLGGWRSLLILIHIHKLMFHVYIRFMCIILYYKVHNRNVFANNYEHHGIIAFAYTSASDMAMQSPYNI